MKNKGTDRRIVKTRHALHRAMIRLLHTNRLEDMTVTMLCKEADISRSAFYDHYSVPEDCFNEIVEEMNDEIINKFLQNEYKTFDEFVDLFFEYIKSNREIFQTLFSMDPSNSEFQKTTSLYREFLHNMDPDFPTYDELIRRALTYGFVGVLRDWVNGDCKEDYHEIADLQMKLFQLLKSDPFSQSYRKQ